MSRVRRLIRQRRSSTLRSFAVGTASTAGFISWCASYSWLFQEYCCEWVSSTGPSMYPTLATETKYLIVDKRYRLGRGLKVGDLVHTKHPTFANLRAGKRILGMPGDFVVRDPPMSPTVGGIASPFATVVKDSSASPSSTDAAAAGLADGNREDGGGGGGGGGGGTGRQEPAMIEVPPGHVWVAGDNLSWSRDSRFFGPVPMGLILGKIVRHSSPASDWMVDTISTSGDQLRPARALMDGRDLAAVGEEDHDEWLVTARSGGGTAEVVEPAQHRSTGQ